MVYLLFNPVIYLCSYLKGFGCCEVLDLASVYKIKSSLCYYSTHPKRHEKMKMLSHSKVLNVTLTSMYRSIFKHEQ